MGVSQPQSNDVMGQATLCPYKEQRLATPKMNFELILCLLSIHISMDSVDIKRFVNPMFYEIHPCSTLK